MNCQEYLAMKAENTINEESWETLWRKWAFLEFDAALEEYVENGKESWDGNDGRSLMEASVTDVECIIDDFIARVEDHVNWYFTEQMRESIQAVTGLVC